MNKPKTRIVYDGPECRLLLEPVQYSRRDDYHTAWFLEFPGGEPRRYPNALDALRELKRRTGLEGLFVYRDRDTRHICCAAQDCGGVCILGKCGLEIWRPADSGGVNCHER